MKIEIEQADNGYIIVIPKNEYEGDDVERKIVIQEKEEYPLDDTNMNEYKAFNDLVEHLQEIFSINNTKHNKIGYITGLCSEYDRWDILQTMEESLKNPRSATGDE